MGHSKWCFHSTLCSFVTTNQAYLICFEFGEEIIAGQHVKEFLNLEVLLTLESVVILPGRDKCRCWNMPKICQENGLFRTEKRDVASDPGGAFVPEKCEFRTYADYHCGPRSIHEYCKLGFSMSGERKYFTCLLLMTVYYLHYISYLYVVVIFAS